jgi:hypothetical protein
MQPTLRRTWLNEDGARLWLTRLLLGDPLPEQQAILPSVEKLKCCSVDRKSAGINTPPSHSLCIDDYANLSGFTGWRARL